MGMPTTNENTTVYRTELFEAVLTYLQGHQL